MDFFDTINERYSVRGYLDKEVEKEKLEKVLEAGRQAPTGDNNQPFKIFVIDTKKNKESLKKIYGPKWFVEAPYVIGVAVSKLDAGKCPWNGKSMAEFDGAIVMDYMILAATALGLGTCFVGGFKSRESIKLLNLEDKYEPLLFTPLGYPNIKSRGIGRKSLEDLVEYI